MTARQRLLFSVVAIVLLLAASCAYGQAPPQAARGVVVWHNELPQAFISDIAVDDSILYIAAGGVGASLFAFNLDGELLWEFAPDPRPLSECPMAGYGIECIEPGPSGTVLAGAGDGVLYMLDGRGALKWKFDTEPAVRSPLRPFIHPDGRLFSLNGRGELFEFDVDGRVLMQMETGRHFFWPQRIQWDSLNRFRIVDTKAEEVVCFADDGSVVWSTPLAGDAATLGYGPDGIVGTIVNWNEVFCIGPEGDVLWSVELENPHSQAFDSTAKLYVSAGESIQVYAQDGTLLTAIGAGRDRQFGGLSVHGGKVYAEGFAPNNEQYNWFHCFDLGGQELWSIGLTSMLRPMTGPVLDAAGNIYLPLNPQVEMDSELETAETYEEWSATVLKVHGPAELPGIYSQ